MAIGTIRKGTAANGTTPLVPALPATMTDPEIMYLFASAESTGAGSYTTPAGWTAGPAIQNGTTIQVATFARRWVTGDAAPSVAWTGAGTGRAIIFAVPGGHLTTLFDGSSSGTGSDATAETAGAANATTHGSMLMHFASSITAGTAHTPYWSMFEDEDNNSGGTTAAFLRMSIASERGMANGAKAQYSPINRATTVAAAAWAAATFWIKPSTAESFGMLQSTHDFGNGATTLTEPMPTTCTSGTFLVATCASFNEATTNFTGGGLAFTSLTARRTSNNTGSEWIQIWYYPNNTATTAISMVQTTVGTNPKVFWVGEYSGLDTVSPFDVQAANGDAGVAGTAISVAITPTAGERLVVNGVTNNNTSVHTFDTEYYPRVDYTNWTTNVPNATQTKTYTADGVTAETANMTITNGLWASVAASFKPAVTSTFPLPKPVTWHQTLRRM